MSAQPVEEVDGVDSVDGEAPGDVESRGGPGDDALREPPHVEVRRNAVASAVLGAAASAVGIAYLWRAAEVGQVLDWVLCGALALLATVFLHSLLDARTPLLIADEMGIRIRLGTTWRGLPWEAIERVVVRPRRGIARDGSVVVQLVHVARSIEGLEGRARRHALINRRVYGGALAVPLGLAVRTDTPDEELSDRIATLSQGRAEVVTLLSEPEVADDEATAATETETPAEEPQPDLTSEASPAEADLVEEETVPGRSRWAWLRRPASAEAQETPELPETSELSESPETVDAPGDLSSHQEQVEVAPPAASEPLTVGWTPREAASEPRPEPGPVGEPQDAEPLPTQRAGAIPLRGAETDRVTIQVDEVPHRSTRAIDAVNSVREAVNPVGRRNSRVRAIAKLGDPVAPLVIDNYQPEPAYDPVIGPELAASRTRVGLSVDELAERTRIRPHVIESMEVDDFTPCGGDFYARGHIRTLSRVLGKDPVPLLEQYEARYAHAPVNARKVFEAELATGMGGQMTRPYGGPNWTGLVAAVLMLVLIWAGVRLFAGDGTEALQEPPPVLDGSAGLSSYYGGTKAASGPKPVSVVLSATEAGADVQVQDGDGNLVHDGELVIGEVKRLRVPPPVTVTSDDGGAVSVQVAGEDLGALGSLGAPATQTFEGQGSAP